MAENHIGFLLFSYPGEIRLPVQKSKTSGGRILKSGEYRSMDEKILVTKSFLPPFEEYTEEIRGPCRRWA